MCVCEELHERMQQSLFLRLLGVYLFSHDYLVALVVNKFILEESKFLAWIYLDSEAVFHLPSEGEVEDALGDVGFHVGVDV